MTQEWIPEEMNEWFNSWTTLSPEAYFGQGYGKDDWSEAHEEVHIKATKTRVTGHNSILVALGSSINLVGKALQRILPEQPPMLA